MALSVVNQWNDATGPVDVQTSVTPTPGNWLVAIVTWKSQAAAVQPTIVLTDPSRNMWTLLRSRTVQASNTVAFSGTAVMNVQVWACPAVLYAGWSTMRVYTAIQTLTAGDIGSVDIKIVEVAGMGNGFLTVDSITLAQSIATTGLTLTVPAPAGAANCLMIAAAASDIAYGSYTTTGTGWTQLSNVTNTNPEVGLFSAWREATTGGTVTFGLVGGFTRLWSGVAVAIRTTGIAPAQQNTNWPATELQLGLGYDLSTPMCRVPFTTLQQPFPSLSAARGIQYELGVAQAESADIKIRNRDGSLSPHDSFTATATANGTTTTFVCSSSDAANFSLGEYVALYNAPLNPNSSFETGTTTGWTGTGGTLTTTTSVGAIGAYAGQMTPNGTTATVQVKTTSHVAVTPNTTYKAYAWLRCAVARVLELRVIWYDSGGTAISADVITLPVVANSWTYATQALTAPPTAASADIAPTMTGTPAATNIMYMDTVVLAPSDEFTAFKITGIATVSGTTTITYTAADGSGGGSLLAPATGGGMASTPVDLYTPYRLLMSWGGKRHYVTAGWAESWPEEWGGDGYVGTVEMTGTGTLANLTAANPTTLAGEIMRRNPHSYWSLGDAAGATSAQNISGRGTAPLVITDSSNGASGTNNFGASTQGIEDSYPSPSKVASLLGDPGNGWQQTGIPYADLAANMGSALVAHDTNFPPIANGVTIFLVHYFSYADYTSFDNTKNPSVITVKNTDASAGSTDSVLKFAFNLIGTTNVALPTITRWDRSTHAATTTQCTAGGQWGPKDYFVTGALSFNKTTWKAYTQGGSLSGSGTCNLADKFSILDIGGEADQYFNGQFCTGTFAHVAIFDRMLTDAEIGALDSAMVGHQGDEYTVNRVQRKLDTIGMHAGRALSYDGQKVCSVEGTDGSTIADIGNLIGGYEDAIVFEDAGANYQYRPPELYSTQSVVAVLGERADLGEIPYLPGVTATYDSTYIYNSITATNSVRSGNVWRGQTLATTKFVAVDATSVSKNGLHDLSRDTRLNVNADVTSLTQRLLSRYATRKQRISEISIDPASNPAAWQFCLTVEVGDLVTVMRRPLNAAAKTIPCMVLQVTQTGSPGAWKTTLTLAPAP